MLLLELEPDCVEMPTKLYALLGYVAFLLICASTVSPNNTSDALSVSGTTSQREAFRPAVRKAAQNWLSPSPVANRGGLWQPLGPPDAGPAVSGRETRPHDGRHARGHSGLRVSANAVII